MKCESVERIIVVSQTSEKRRGRHYKSDPQDYRNVRVETGADAEGDWSKVRNLIGILLLLFGVPVIIFGIVQAKRGVQERSSPEWTNQLVVEMHTLVNEERQKVGLRSLIYDTRLEKMALKHSTDMGIRNYFEHDTPEGLSPSDRAVRDNYTCRKEYGSFHTEGIGENIHQGYLYKSESMLSLPGPAEFNRVYYELEELATLVIEDWMNSPGHRRNILTATYDNQGLGVYITDGEEVYTTQNFC